MAARKAVKATKIAAEAVGGTEAVISGGKSIAEGIQNGDYLEASLGALQAVAGAGQLGNAANQATDFTKYGSKIFNKDAKVPENSSIFWTGCGDAGITARNYATENGGITLEMFIEQEGIRAPKWNPKPSSAGWWDDASKEFAELASGQTEVLVGPRVTQTSVFNRIELPTLMKNENVSSISIKPTKVE